MQKTWRVRDGRGKAHTLWRDELDDVLARIGLSRASIDEAPPARPTGDMLSASRMDLWAAALHQYQCEGTLLYDIVRPSLVVDGPYANRDIRLLST